MATSSRGNNELLNVQQIGRGPAECQMGLQAGVGTVGMSAGLEWGWGTRQNLTKDLSMDAGLCVSSESEGATLAGHLTHCALPLLPVTPWIC